MAILRILVAAVQMIAAGAASADAPTYGSFVYASDLPGVLFLTGEIKRNDSFELRRAMRDDQIDLVVAASPGGDLYEGLQIAAILHDNGIATYVPEGASCESSCANIFLGGTNRLVVGELGVHQFYPVASVGNTVAPRKETTAYAQYTTADIIGIMNQFDTPPFVYEKMFGTTAIYYFTGSEKAMLNKGLGNTTFGDRLAGVDTFLSETPVFLARPSAAPAPAALAEAPALVTPTILPISPTLNEAAIDILVSINSDWSRQNQEALPRLSDYYAPNVDFYGSALSHAEVMVEKETFATRWPIRQYSVEPGTVRIDCSSQRCVVDSVIAWVAASPERGAKASGRSTWSLVLVVFQGGLKITGESGKTLKRN